MGSFKYPEVDLNNATAVAEWYETHKIPQRYNAAIVVASMLVAVLGSYSTLIVLGKRTSNAGARNAVLLVWGAMTMSCVGIWGMHFIGMNFRLEPLPGESWYVSFSPGFTVFSLVVPFVALVLAFVFVDYFTLRLWRIVASGILTGCIVGLMHYSASMKCNFHVSYAPAQTIVSIVLACICAIIALTLFFRLRAQWQDSWQRRLLCSFILATGVSGMHYIGSWGTSYSMRPEYVHNLDKVRSGRHSNVTIVIIVAVMCFVIVVASTFMSISDVLMARETRKKARKIVLASASFDHLGRLLVQADGSLPLVVLEEKTLRHVEVLNALDSRSETFQWLFSVSWAWNIVVPFLDAIAKRVGQTADANGEHATCKQGEPCSHTWHARLARKLRIDAHSRRARRDEREANMSAAGANATSFNAGIAQSLRALSLFDFRDHVVDAARRLAEQLEVPLEEVGVFYDHTLPTGTQKHLGPRASLARRQNKLFSRGHDAASAGVHAHGPSSEGDEEASISTSRAPSIFADGEDDEEGVSIFLVREMNAEHQTLLAKRGYRFTETRFLASMLADRHAVSKSTMEDLLDGLRLYARRGTRPVVQPGGVYAGLFGVRPSMSARQGGLDVLVYNFARHQIPAFRLPDIAAITPEMRAFLHLLDQMPVDQALRFCERESIRSAERNKAIARLLLDQAQVQYMAEARAGQSGTVMRRNPGGMSSSAGRLPSSTSRVLTGGGSHNDNGDIDEDVDDSLNEQRAAMDTSTTSEDSLRMVMDLQTQEASLQSFQIALYTALEALMQSVRVFPRLNATARISSDVLEVPSSLDDAKAPAQVILVQAVLPADKAPSSHHHNSNARASSSTLGGLMSPTSGHAADFTSSVGSNATAASVAAAAAPTAPSSLVMPTERAQSGTPFVFTPYSLFTKAQMMLLRGPTAQTFGVEVQQALGRRYNVDPIMYQFAGNEKAHSLCRSDVGFDETMHPDDVMSTATSAGKSIVEVDDDDEDTATNEKSHVSMPSAKRWITQLSKFSATGKPPQAERYEGDSQGHEDGNATKASKPSIASLTKSDDTMLHNSRQQQHTPTVQRKSQPNIDSPPPSSSSGGTLVASPHPTSTATTPGVRPGTSLGIRRFTGPNNNNGFAITEDASVALPTSIADQGRFPRAAEEMDGDTNEKMAASSDVIIARAASRNDVGHHSSSAAASLQPTTPRRRSSAANSYHGGAERTTPPPPPPPAHVLFQTSSSPLHPPPSAHAVSAANFFSRPRSRTVGTQGSVRRPSTTQAVMSVDNARLSRRTDLNKSSLPAQPPSTDEYSHRPHSAFAITRRPSTATGVTGATEINAAPLSNPAAVSFAVHDGIQARHRLDNWQSRQLRDLERFQPNLLLGVLPNDY